MKKTYLIIGAVFFFFVFTIPSAYAWWDTDYGFKKTITITENAGQLLHNYSMPFNVSYEAGMIANFSDLRFVNTTGDELPHWREAQLDGSWAYVWVLMGYVDAATTTKTIDMYYGNSVAPDVSDIHAVAIIGIDCEDDDHGDWSGGTVDCQAGTVLAGTSSISMDTTNWGYIYMIDPTIPENFTMIFMFADDGTDESSIGLYLLDDEAEAAGAFRWYSRNSGDAKFAQRDDGGLTTGSATAAYRVELTGTTPDDTGENFKSYLNYSSTADIASSDYKTPADLDRIGFVHASSYDTFFDNVAVFNSTGDRATMPTGVFGAETAFEIVDSETLLMLNDTQANRTYEVGEYANFSAVTNITGIAIYLDSDYTGWEIQAGTTSLDNSTYLNTIGDNWNVTAYIVGNASVNPSNQTYYFNVTIPTAPPAVAEADFGVIITFITDRFKTILVR